MVTSATGLPLGSRVVGGTFQSLIVMKGDGPYWQVTGDPDDDRLEVQHRERFSRHRSDQLYCAHAEGPGDDRL